MRGKCHVTTGIVTAGVVADTLFLMNNSEIDSISYNISEIAKKFLLDDGNLPTIVFLAVSILLYLLGTLLPDIDYPYSTIGKIVHIPIEHRTWTHAVWIPAGLCLAGIIWRPLFYLGMGMIVHIFWDAFSASGISWLYPIKNKHHIFKVYDTGHFSEYVFVACIILVFVMYTLFCLQSVYHFVNVSF